MGHKMLGQLRPSGTTAVQVYSPAGTGNVMVRELVMYICNTGGATETYDLYVDPSGSIFSDNTIFNKSVSIAPNKTIVESMSHLSSAIGAIGVKTSTGNALTFTLFGNEIP